MMKIMKKAFAMFVAVFTLLATLCMVPVSAATIVAAQLYGRIEDNGQAIYKMVLDYGNVKVSGVDKDTYTVHAKTTTEGKRPADEKAYGDYDTSSEDNEFSEVDIMLCFAIVSHRMAVIDWSGEEYSGQVKRECLDEVKKDGKEKRQRKNVNSNEEMPA